MVLGSTTVKSESVLDIYPYIIEIDNNVWVVSDQQPIALRTTSLSLFFDRGYPFDKSEFINAEIYILSPSENTFVLFYDENLGYHAYLTDCLKFSSKPNPQYFYYMYFYESGKAGSTINSSVNIPIRTSPSGNNTNYFYSNNAFTSNIPDLIDINQAIQEAINSTTNTTNEVQTLQADLASSYSSYQSGNITGDTLQSDIDTTVSTLNNLSETTGNTLADLMAVNNGLTYAQTVQDKLNADEINQHLEITTAVKNAITGYINQSNTAYTQYTNGNKTQSETITTLQNQVIYLNQIITNGTAKNSADIEAVNSAINTVQGIINNVSNYSDVDKELSSEYESGEQAEKEFLEDEIAETTSQIQDMSAEQQFSSQQKTESLNILGSIWDLEIFKRLIPICAVFMVVCVAIGVKYRL